MDKRLFIAVALSIAFLWAWGALMPRLFPELAKPRTPAAKTERNDRRSGPGQPLSSPAPEGKGGTAQPTVSPVKSPAVTAKPAPPVASQPLSARMIRTTVVETTRYRAEFSNRGAQLISFRLKNYKAADGSLVDLVKSRDAEAADYPFALQVSDAALNTELNHALYELEQLRRNGTTTLHYRLVTARGVSVDKVFELKDDYQFSFDATVKGTSASYRVVLGPGIENRAATAKDTQFITTGNGVVLVDDSFKSIQREKARGLEVFDQKPEFIGIEDNYFLTVLQPTVGGSGIFRSVSLPSPEEGEKPRRELIAGINADGGRTAGKAFFGPKQADVLERFGLEKTLKFGVFGLIARFLLIALNWIYSFTSNYGWAIILLTVVIKLVLYPLQHKSIVSMKKMQKLQPKVNALKDKYRKAKTDPEQRQKMNTEMMKLYSQEGVNPMSGCLPILLQLPILWAFYSLLSHAIELRGADFMLWITDLSAKDPYYITPILMTITMFVQQWMTPTTADPAQKRIFMIMPLIFGWIFKEFPSGLVLYWLAQNILTIVQQMIMNRYWKEHPLA